MNKAITLEFIKKHRKIMKTNDLDSFLESDEYNDLKNEESKKNLFYLVTFINSAKNYQKLDLINKDLSLIIEYINSNEQYFKNIHESYKFTVCNYLEKALFLIKNNNVILSTEFISDLNNFVEIVSKIYYPNIEAKVDIIKALMKIEEQLEKNKFKIKREYTQRYERYIKELKLYIQKNNIDKNNCHIYYANNIFEVDYPIINNSSIFNKSLHQLKQSNIYDSTFTLFSKNDSCIDNNIDIKINYNDEDEYEYEDKDSEEKIKVIGECKELIDKVVIPEYNKKNYYPEKKDNMEFNNKLFSKKNNFQNLYANNNHYGYFIKNRDKNVNPNPNNYCSKREYKYLNQNY